MHGYGAFVAAAAPCAIWTTRSSVKRMRVRVQLAYRRNARCCAHENGDEFGSIAVLAAVTVLWGSQHAVMKGAVLDGVGAGALNALRFGMGAILLSPWLVGAREKELKGGLELGVWSFLGFALQTVALDTVGAARSCFLLYLNVKLVPLLRLLGGTAPPPIAWLAAAVALCGTALLAGDGGASWVIGDTLSVCAALASAVFIVRLGARAVDERVRAAPLSAATVASTALFAVVGAAFRGETLPDASALPAALYLGAVPTALATVLQARAQRFVPPERAAVIYAMDPVFGALFANWLLGERFGARGVAGATLIVFAALLSKLATNKADAHATKEQIDEPARAPKRTTQLTTHRLKRERPGK